MYFKHYGTLCTVTDYFIIPHAIVPRFTLKPNNMKHYELSSSSSSLSIGWKLVDVRYSFDHFPLHFVLHIARVIVDVSFASVFYMSSSHLLQGHSVPVVPSIIHNMKLTWSFCHIMLLALFMYCLLICGKSYFIIQSL